MKYIFYLLCAALISLAFCGCSFRKIQAEKTVMADTVKSSFARSEQLQELSSHEIQVKDTAIRIPMRYAVGSISWRKLLPVFNSLGQPVAQTFKAVRPGITAELTVGSDSNITFSAQADSMMIQIQGLRREVKELRSMLTVKTDSTAVQSKQVMTYKQFFKKSGGWLFNNWQVVALIVFGCVILELIHRLKKQKNA